MTEERALGELVSLTELAEMHGVSRPAVVNWVVSGLPSVIISGKKFVDPADVEPWKKQHAANKEKAIKERAKETKQRQAQRKKQAREKREAKKAGRLVETATDYVEKAYIAGMDFDFRWDMKDVKKFIKHYADLKQQGSDPRETVSILSDRFKRPDYEVAILIMDLGEKSKIRPDGAHDLVMGWR